MTASTILEMHAIGRRQYGLLLQRDLRRTRRELRRMLATDMLRRCLEGVAFFCSVTAFSYAFFGWLGV